MMRLYFITALIASQAFIFCGQTGASIAPGASVSDSGSASVSDSPSNSVSMSSSPSNSVSMSSSPSSSVSMSASTPSSVSMSASTSSSVSVSASTPSSVSMSASTPSSVSMSASTPSSVSTSASPSSSVSMSASPSTTVSMSAPPSTSVSMSAPPSTSVSMSASPSDSVSMSTSPSTSVSMSDGETSTPTSTSESTASVTTTQPPTTVTVVIIEIYVKEPDCDVNEFGMGSSRFTTLQTNLTTNLKNIYSENVTKVELQSGNECKDMSAIVRVKVTFRAGLNFIIANVFETEIGDGLLGNLPVSSLFKVTPFGVDFDDCVADGECQRVCCDGGAGGQVNLDRTCTPKEKYSCDGIRRTITAKGYCPGEENDQCSKVCDAGCNHSPSIFLLLLTAVASFFKFSV